jgi:protein-S-isoprenylcysteine O-methyltransferase Ste14
MHGDSANSIGPRLAMTATHAAGVGVAAYFLLGSGVSSRTVVVLVCSLAYFLRYLLTSFYLLNRGVKWSEAAQVGPFLFAIQALFGFLTSGKTVPLRWLDWIALGIYVIGSFLNTGAELQRKRWKADPAHKGHLYREGLFSLSMHINYFGDVLLFTGFALVTSSAWALLIPFLMAIMFVFVHIPMLDSHLVKRYPDEFSEWARESKKLMPFVY